jgi:hypothetical protein
MSTESNQEARYALLPREIDETIFQWRDRQNYASLERSCPDQGNHKHMYGKGQRMVTFEIVIVDPTVHQTLYTSNTVVSGNFTTLPEARERLAKCTPLVSPCEYRIRKTEVSYVS